MILVYFFSKGILCTSYSYMELRSLVGASSTLNHRYDIDRPSMQYCGFKIIRVTELRVNEITFLFSFDNF